MPALSVNIKSLGFSFSWDLEADQARLTVGDANDAIWHGSLLPLFWLRAGAGERRAVKARALRADGANGARTATIALDLPGFGSGQLHLAWAETWLKFEALTVDWSTPVAPEISALHFGAGVLSAEQRAGAPSLEVPFWPDWRAEGFAVASAKTNPMQSFFRSWDFGQANIALGSFGPATGTPYAAAFPRPVYAACAGGQHGWVCFGAGAVPDAALTFQVRNRSGALEWRYREDLWGAPEARSRTWENPLWLTWADTAWLAYRNYFRLFPETEPKSGNHQKSFWGTWGDFRFNQFEWRSAVDRARQLEADLVCIDDPWESRKGTCRPHPERLPSFSADVAYAHEQRMGLGVWMPIGWIEDPFAEGLTTNDLLLGRDGQPVRANWAMDPHDTGQQFYCLDPASPRTLRFLRERTERVVRDYRPTLLKIDFGYGMPGPDAATSRDPALRGERLSWTLARTIAEAAHRTDPTLTILGYSIHPLWSDLQDEVSLDDLGDAGMHEAAGHGHWSIWAALAADRGTALMGSSGYLWSADTDILMNSAILGAPGANLPRTAMAGGLPAASLARRQAVFRWHRRPARWEPLWLDSTPGNLAQDPTVRSWGRLELRGTATTLTALALREPSPAALAVQELGGLQWSGRWVILSQDDDSIFDAASVALIPFGPGALRLPRRRRPGRVLRVEAKSEQPHDGWEWREGFLTVSIDATTAEQPLLGFLIRD